MKLKVRGILTEAGIEFDVHTQYKLKDFAEKRIGSEVIVKIDTDINSRSEAQNRFFHGALVRAMSRTLVLAGKDNGHDLEYVKEIILKKPLLTVYAGTEKEFVRGTSSLGVKEFWELCYNCIRLIVYFGGSLEADEQAEYMEIVDAYGLDEAIDEVLR